MTKQHSIYYSSDGQYEVRQGNKVVKDKLTEQQARRYKEQMDEVIMLPVYDRDGGIKCGEC